MEAFVIVVPICVAICTIVIVVVSIRIEKNKAKRIVELQAAQWERLKSLSTSNELLPEDSVTKQDLEEHAIEIKARADKIIDTISSMDLKAKNA